MRDRRSFIERINVFVLYIERMKGEERRVKNEKRISL